MENHSTKNTTFFRFEDLRVYHRALDYIDWVYSSTGLFPDENAKDLISKLNSSAQTIAFYLAEGSARNKSQFIYYLKMAKSNVRECVVLTAIFEKQGIMTDTQVEESRNFLMELTKMIGALIGSLQRSSNRNRERDNGGNGGSANNDFVLDESIDIKKY
ncbi:MAG: four helix bundle protein [Bacteroidales bacterium]|nr:four helix bundle protein [Bacteroidales bacterium]